MRSADLNELVRSDADQLELALVMIVDFCADVIGSKDQNIMFSFAKQILLCRHLSEKQRRVAIWKVEKYGHLITHIWGNETLNQIRRRNSLPEARFDVEAKDVDMPAHWITIDGLDEISKVSTEGFSAITSSSTEVSGPFSRAARAVMSEIERRAIEGEGIGKPVSILRAVDFAKDHTSPRHYKTPNAEFILAIGFGNKHITLIRNSRVTFEETYETEEELNLALDKIEEIFEDQTTADIVFGGD